MNPVTQALIDGKNQLTENMRSRAPEEEDPVKDLMIPGISAHNPPGELSTFCNIIENHFEWREGCEMFRIIGALGAAQVLAGRNITSPTGSKCMFQMMLLATSGAGKSAPIEFISQVAVSMGIHSRFLGSTVTSTKQLQMAVVEGDGSLIYVADDCASHVKNWDNERSPLDGISSMFRTLSSSSVPWVAPSPIRRQFDEDLASAASSKAIEAKARAEGWIIPRIDGTKEIDYMRFEKMNQDIAKRYAKAKRDSMLAGSPIDRMKFIPIITMVLHEAKGIISSWQDNGSMGRTFFVCDPRDSGDFKDIDNDPWHPRSFVNEWKARVPAGLYPSHWGVGAKDKYDELRRRIDSLRHEPGITGSVSARYGQLVGDMATLCAFCDMSSRTAKDFTVNVNHLEWAYQAALESLLAMRNYAEGEPDDNGLEVNEWQNILSKVRKSVEGNAKFKQFKTVATLKDRLCRDKIKNIIDAYASSGANMTPEKFTYLVIECIGQYRYAPIALDEENPRKVVFLDNGRWNDIQMNTEIRNILTSALRRMRFMPKK